MRRLDRRRPQGCSRSAGTKADHLTFQNEEARDHSTRCGGRRRRRTGLPSWAGGGDSSLTCGSFNFDCRYSDTRDTETSLRHGFDMRSTDPSD